jgi:hypothetical protein
MAKLLVFTGKLQVFPWRRRRFRAVGICDEHYLASAT